MKAVVCGAFADLLFNILLMPRHGCLGAAIATLIAEMIQMMIQFNYAKKYIIPNVNYKKMLVIVISICVATLVMCCARNCIELNRYLVRFIACGMVFFITYGIALITFREEYLMSYINVIQSKIGKWK